MFCKYCGKELQEGEVCSCRQTVDSQSESSIKSESDYKNLASEEADLFWSFLKKPIDTMKAAYISENKKRQFIAGGIYAVMLLLCSMIAIMRIGKFGNAFLTGLSIMLACIVVKVIFTGILFAFSKKLGGDIKAIFAEVCVSTIPETLSCLILLVCSLLGFGTGTILMLLMLWMVGIITEAAATGIVFSENRNLGYWVYLLNQLVITFIGIVIVKNIVISAIQRAVTGWFF